MGRRNCSLWIRLIAGVLVGIPSISQTFAAPATAPAADPSKVDVLLEHLNNEYAKLMKSADWMTRGLAVISMNRVPRDSVTARLLDVLRTDKDPIVRLTAWHAILSRADRLTPEQYRDWLTQTGALQQRGVFGGQHRVSLLAVLATVPYDSRARIAFADAFDHTSAMEPTDAPVIVALGKCLSAWKSADLMEVVLKKFGEPSHKRKAAAVLAAAGVPLDDVPGWWKTNKPQWKTARQIPGEPWKSLQPQFLSPPDWSATIDHRDPTWQKDLELTKPTLKSFDLAFVVDATGSMSSVIRWLRTDISATMKSLLYVAAEPRISITFYRDKDDEFVAKTLPLTNKMPALAQAVNTTEAGGGGDTPEAVLDGIQDSLTKNPWSKKENAPKVMILIGDAPPKPGTEADAEKLVAAAAERGLKLYAVKVGSGTRTLPQFDRLASAGKGLSLAVEPDKGIGEVVLTRVLVDAINPQYADRVEPLVRVLIEAMTSRPSDTGDIVPGGMGVPGLPGTTPRPVR